MTTERLYHDDALLQEFQATVVGLDADGAVLLDRTAFYPESGGQDCDTGTLSSLTAAGEPPTVRAWTVRAVEDRAGAIAHLLEDTQPEPPQPGQTLRGRIDWMRRLSLMQHHSGQHLLSAVALQHHGWETVSVHLGVHNATVEFAISSAEAAALADLERRANLEIAAALPITATFYPPGEAPVLRKTVQREGPLRVVSIEGLDRSACGGTHVPNTAQIGCLLLGATERIRKNLRVEFVCGLRAVERAAGQRDLLAQVTTAMQCAAHQAPAMLARQREELIRLGKREAVLARELATWRGRQARAELALDANGNCVAVQWTAANPGEVERAFALAFCEMPGSILLAANRESGSFLLATHPESGFHAQEWLRLAGAALGAKGGGSAAMVNGRLPSPEALDALAATLPGGNPRVLGEVA
ncbi:MAG: alanyl-tRNA editing protein [Bryobacterales bacterium]|jgi:alanyl-tRNA synthetase|nr:alanyl-tRNA editing protein [Bryobacterales bacterium]